MQKYFEEDKIDSSRRNPRVFPDHKQRGVPTGMGGKIGLITLVLGVKLSYILGAEFSYLLG